MVRRGSRARCQCSQTDAAPLPGELQGGEFPQPPCLPFLERMEPLATNPTPAGPSGPHHATLWGTGPPPPQWGTVQHSPGHGGPSLFWTTGWLPETPTALLFFYFFSSSSKLANVNNQKNTHTETYFSTLLQRLLLLPAKQAQLPGPTYVSGEPAAQHAATEDGLACTCQSPGPGF